MTDSKVGPGDFSGSVYLKGIEPAVIEKARKVRLLALDVDGVLTDGRLYFDQTGQEMKAFSTRDGMGIKALQRSDIKVALVTGRQSYIVSRRAEELGVDLVVQGSHDKWKSMQSLLSGARLSADQACFAGDDWMDVAVMSRVGFAVTVADADPWVREQADWVTSEAGGRGAIRALCNLILAAQGKIEPLLREYRPA
jgi:3-deoxy-D-manno-octulosonate 8-phosphate phosphatase (KDO 8-P phosphatase)